ncbi:MAG: DUF192 domain-containing protein [Candidatus Thiodiazotropha sp. (ex Ctena orbiculata)]|uniref:DUF192 domain-containing protein n=1 Tax=Candidatus Thiodiazotropha taylori TaxID=2792791 RepID=A0A944QVH9_9GAMM|nr:DUF192 domain-containing protein [Candidatus Thiodiazotropha taylori]MBT2990019.1 DUF192 domain-containing protein [Candidatus Thiodiazotropha taylori]MBT2998258.1 DUF192 domain-containing protein [Candidatus Thiodiazotropha taylori]MBT3002631.1 DUF192 domain-containing protein [Candidatus Thiodiazotropha taylori]MBT3029328.1 DUF192 domain-containing protein [Candidatus Thiodiazotropha taylori]
MKRICIKRLSSENELDKENNILEAWLADSYFTRLRGLLGKKKLGDKDGLLLVGCSSVHTFGMRYPLDLVFLDKKGKVVKCREYVQPFRTASARGAYFTLELNKGMISKQGISVDDRFHW